MAIIVERITGSLAFGALARIVLVVAKKQKQSQDGLTINIFLRVKSNIGPDDGGFEYELQQNELNGHFGITTSSIIWREPLYGSARDLLMVAEWTEDKMSRKSKEDAMQFLSELLANGPKESIEVQEKYIAAGYSDATIRRAKEKLNIVSIKEGGHFGSNEQKWLWKLPVEDILTS